MQPKKNSFSPILRFAGFQYLSIIAIMFCLVNYQTNKKGKHNENEKIKNTSKPLVTQAYVLQPLMTDAVFVSSGLYILFFQKIS